MTAIKPEGASHWYSPSGDPCHEVLRADGTSYRPTTLADARKLRLLPSVTNIMSVLRKPYLDAWKIERYLDALAEVYAMDIPAEDRITAAVELAETKMAEPRDLGSAYHETIETLVRLIDFDGEFVVPTDGVKWRAIHAFCEFYEAHCKTTIHPETSFACARGYGGTIDWRGDFRDDWAGTGNAFTMFAIIDWKTQGTKPGKPVNWYKDWPCQLAAYAYGIDKPSALLVNVVISTTEPGRIEWRVWEEGAEYWFDAFEKVFAVWRGPLKSNYDPREG